jgi:hypothetical protein
MTPTKVLRVSSHPLMIGYVAVFAALVTLSLMSRVTGDSSESGTTAPGSVARDASGSEGQKAAVKQSVATSNESLPTNRTVVPDPLMAGTGKQSSNQQIHYELTMVFNSELDPGQAREHYERVLSRSGAGNQGLLERAQRFANDVKVNTPELDARLSRTACYRSGCVVDFAINSSASCAHRQAIIAHQWEGESISLPDIRGSTGAVGCTYVLLSLN